MFNPIAKDQKPNLVVNPEGGIQPEINPLKRLFFTASGLRFKTKGTKNENFYFDNDDLLGNFREAVDNVDDIQYIIGLARFLSKELGIKLAPVLMLTHLVLTRELKSETKQMIKSAISDVFDRPDKIANALGYCYYSGMEISLPAFYKRGLKSALERFSPYTLKKFKMKRRLFSLADLIKILHPNGKKLGATYKAIIENDPSVSLKKNTLVDVLSNIVLTDKEKDTWVKENLNNIPINQLLRNLNALNLNDDDINTVDKRFRLALLGRMTAIKQINPFDILTAICTIKDFRLVKRLDDLLSAWLESLNIHLENRSIYFLVDTSGSMDGSGLDIVGDYFSLLMPILKSNNISIASFDTEVYPLTEKNRNELLMAGTPYNTKKVFNRIFRSSGGTSLADAIREVSSKYKPNILIVFSDEVSWADNNANYIDRTLCPNGIRTIAINPNPSGKYTVFNDKLPLVKLTARDAKILYYITILEDFNTFVKFIKDIALE